MKKRLLLLFGALVIVAAGLFYYRAGQAQEAPLLVTAPVLRGDVVESVDATGTLEAVTTVQVGTQVSGTIKTLHADFNSRVRRGDVVAELESSLFQTQVEQARATVARLEADAQRAAVQLEDAEAKLVRARTLATRQLLAAADLEAAEATARQAAAAIRSAEAQTVQARAALNQARVNLAHTVITAPIDGIVISRNVDVGQTVAASMQAPTLFVIARDLSRMQVYASISEADIGRIESGQPVTFRVDAYPGEVFSGAVSQVRLQPVIEQNVVSYVTVIDVANPREKLKPGMTANVAVEVARASGVLRIPNAALRLRPSAEVLTAFGQAPQAEAPRKDSAQVWVLKDGQLSPVSVTAGISDGTMTALSAGAIEEGAEVVTSIPSQPVGAESSGSPLLPFGGRRPGAGTPTQRTPGGAPR
jgi:HlyD family secretion protein